MRALIVIPFAALAACTPDAPCLEDRQCPSDTACVAGACVGEAVSGRADLLYIDEFRLRLDVDCGACHGAGVGDVLPAAGDGRWRFYRGGVLDQAQLQASWDDLQDWTGGATPEDTPLLAFGRGQGDHPSIWRFPGQVTSRRLVNWLWTFEGRAARPTDGGVPAPDQGPPDGGPPQPPAARDGYDALHGDLLSGCGCHQGDPAATDNWYIAADDVAGSYEATLRYVNLEDAAVSALLVIGDAGTTRSGGAHPTPFPGALKARVEAWIRGG